MNSGLRSSGLRRISQGVWWMTRWWWPQTGRGCRGWLVPPLIQWVRWWAWHISGGRRQAGKVQCRSRRTRAVQMAAVTGRRSRPTSRTSPWVPRTAGMISASHASRRRTSGGRSVPSAVVPDPGCVEVVLEGVVVEGDQEPGGGAVGLRRQVGVQGVLGGGDQGVPEPGAVVARVAVSAVPGRLGSRAGSGQVRGSSAAIRRAPSSADPRPRSRTPPARSAADGEVAVQVGGTFLTFQGGFEPAVDGVGVDHLDQVPARPWRARRRRGVRPGGAGPSPRGGGPGHRTAGRRRLGR